MAAPDKWIQIKELFNRALELEPEDRIRFLNESCNGNDDLRRELESLLAHHDEADSFIEVSAFDVATRAFNEEEASGERRIGAYRIIREIARGGMGAVYLAVRDDDQYEKQVAVKLIKRGMDTDFIVRRFLSERQILANLDHPNIARLLDGGTTESGLPYFVMEYVEGKPMLDYCNEKQLSTSERLKLFRQVCAAAHYAHQNLIIHRDLKPSNILVTDDGTVKLLDFGIAKLLAPNESEAVEATRTALRMMTPEYASPEQIKGERVTTASDVYSLGVVLYEMLTGHRPYAVRDRLPHEIVEIVCNLEPDRPSDAATRGAGDAAILPKEQSASPRLRASASQLKGDIDNIILMAMRKEPERRYSSVEQFSEDIRRHLEGLPVIARKDTFAYRAGKFIRRNKATVAAAALITLTLIAGIIATTWQARKAQAERARAERRFNEVRKLANSVLFNYHDAIEQLPGSTAVREQMLKDALAYLDSLSAEASDDPALQRELASAYEKVGDIQGNSYLANVNDSSAMLESYRKSASLREAVAAREPANDDVRRELAYSYEKIGDGLAQIADLTGALESYERARAIIEALAARDSKHKLYLARLYNQIGNTQGFPGGSNLGDTAGAMQSYRKAVEITESLYASDTSSVKYRWGLIVYRRSLGNLLRETGDLEGALNQLRAAEPLAESWAKEDPNNVEAQRALSQCYGKISDILVETDSLKDALVYQQKALKISEVMLEADPVNAQARNDMSIDYFKLSALLGLMNDSTGAREAAMRGLEIIEKLAFENPSNTELQIFLAGGLSQAGRACAKAGDRAAALNYYRKATSVLEKQLASDAKNIFARDELATSLAGIGAMLAKSGDTSAALESYRSALAIREEMAAADPNNASMRRALAALCGELADACVNAALKEKSGSPKSAEHWREARRLYERSLNEWNALRARNGLSKRDAAEPDRIAREIARCNAALAK